MTRPGSAAVLEEVLRNPGSLEAAGWKLSARDRRALEEFVRQLRGSTAPAPVRLPMILLDNALATSGDWRKHGEQVDLFERQGLLARRPDPETIRLLREQGEMEVEPSAWGLASPEWRLLHAVLALYSESGIEGEEYAVDTVPEDWPLIYRAAGLPPIDTRGRSGDFSRKRRAELQQALAHLAHEPGTDRGRRVPVFIKRKRPDGKWDYSAADCYVLERRPFWLGLDDVQAMNLTRKPPDEWPEPDAWHLRVNPGLRIGLDNYWRLVPGDLWQRLEAGSRAVVSIRRGVQARDYTFALWLAAQWVKPDPDTGKFVARVDRLELADRIPALREYKRRRQMAYLEKYTRQTYEVARRAGLLRQYRVDVETAVGRRDVFELDPHAFPGLERRTQLALPGEVGASPSSPD